MEPIEDVRARCAALTDDELFRRLEIRTEGERAYLAETLAILGELQSREAALPRGYSSLFVYCVRRLGYCERTAYRRLAAAKLCRTYPAALDRLREGRLHLSALVILADVMTANNHGSLLERAHGASLEQLRRLAAELAPEDRRPVELTRVIAVSAAAQREAAVSKAEQPPPQAQSRSDDDVGELLPLLSEPPAHAATPAPDIEIRFEHRFSVTEATESKLRRAKTLLGHRVPRGEVELVFDAALDALLDRLDPMRRGRRTKGDETARERESRRIPEWVKRRVRERDGERCAFVSSDGTCCGETTRLEFDHVKPWSLGGRSDDPENVRLLCRAHNKWLGDKLIRAPRSL